MSIVRRRMIQRRHKNMEDFLDITRAILGGIILILLLPFAWIVLWYWQKRGEI